MARSEPPAGALFGVTPASTGAALGGTTGGGGTYV